MELGLTLSRGPECVPHPSESFSMPRDLPPEGLKCRRELDLLKGGEAERAAKWAAAVPKEAGED